MCYSVSTVKSDAACDKRVISRLISLTAIHQEHRTQNTENYIKEMDEYLGSRV